METRQSHLNPAKQDKFILVFDIPPILKKTSGHHKRDNKSIIPDSVQFSIHGSLVPEVTVKGVLAKFAGSGLYVSSFAKDAPPPVNVKFNVDSQYNNYWTIYSWLNLLHDQQTGVYNQSNIPVDGNFNDYQTDLTIYGLDEYGKKRIKFTYKKAFPTTLDSITYENQGTEAVLIESGFTFLYSQMHVELLNET